MGERSTARLLDKSYQVDAFHDIPFGGAGNSIDRKINYIDRQLYEEVMDGEFKKTGQELEARLQLMGGIARQRQASQKWAADAANYVHPKLRRSPTRTNPITR
jgi:hypothetical protein